MDKVSLGKLNNIAELVHEKNTAQLAAAKAELQRAYQKRRALLQRSGQEISSSESEVVSILAQAKWSNSVEAGLPALEKEIQDLKNEIDRLVARTRASFTKVKGIEALIKERQVDTKLQASKREEQKQDLLIALRWAEDKEGN